jgi:zinc D-Ala-D-Ala dipeptidase
MLFTLWTIAMVSAASPQPPPKLIRVRDVIPDVVEDLRYATPDNFMKKKVYPDNAQCYLRKESLERLAVAAERLRAQGYRLKLYDCYRPHAVQWKMWEVFPKPGYVADPRKGSNHNRGGAVDLGLVKLDGTEVEMPTPYDTFTEAAHHGYSGGTQTARKHREILREAMTAAGFTINKMEWWHYDVPNPTRFPVLNVSFEELEKKKP